MNEIIMPPFSVCRMCKNCMNEICLEDCAPKGDLYKFDLKDGVNLHSAPRFPFKEFMESMSPKVRQVVVAAYMTLIVDHELGIERYEHRIFRPHADRTRSFEILTNLPLTAVSDDPAERDTLHQTFTPPTGNPGE